MKSNNERGATTPPSRSRVDVSPTGRVLHGDLVPFLFQRPRRYSSSLLTERQALLAGAPVMISLEMDYSSIERRIIAANPQAAQYLKR